MAGVRGLPGAPCCSRKVGFESAGGIAISIAWPDRTIAADIGLESRDRFDLEAEEWTVLALAELVVQLDRAGERV